MSIGFTDFKNRQGRRENNAIASCRQLLLVGQRGKYRRLRLLLVKAIRANDLDRYLHRNGKWTV